MSTFVEEIQNRPERALCALEKAKKIEEKRISNGWKYVRINQRDAILVECGDDGRPTIEGEKRIKRYLERKQ